MRTKHMVLPMAFAVLAVVAPTSAQEPAEAVTATIQSTEVTRQGDWIIREPHPELEASETVEFEGELNQRGECVYEFFSVSSGDTQSGHVRLYREVAYNPVDCISRYERANVPIEDLDDFIGSEGGDEVDEDFQPNAERTETGTLGSPVPLGSTSYSAWYKTVWEDPINLDVNSVRVNLSWTSNGSCVTDSWNHSANWYYYSPTGWYIVSNYGSGAQNCNHAATQATGNFGNWDWHDPDEYTYTRHRDTTIYGFASGSIGIANNMTKGGEDSGILFKDFVCSWTSC